MNGYQKTLSIYFMLNLMLTFRINAEEIICKNSTESTSYRFECPNILYTLKSPYDLNIKCSGIDRLDSTIIPPDLSYGEKYLHMDIENCPIPRNGFHEILARFHVKELKRLRFIEKTTNNSFKSEDFRGMEFLNELNLEKNSIQYLVPTIFKHTPNLSKLVLDDNYLDLADDQFKEVNSLSYLSLAKNNISRLPLKIFRDLQHLKELHLQSNKIEQIEQGVFDDLVNLEFLFLNHNRLHKLDEFTFKYLKNLRNIHLNGNRLSNVSRNIFMNNKELEEIYLDENKNLTLNDLAFSQFLYLSTINLKNSGINILPANPFLASTNLKKIYLNYNNLKFLPRGTFKNLESLEELYLDNNELDEIHSDVFGTLNNLRKLHLHHNNLTTVNGDILQILTNLIQINLSFNRIQTIHSNMFSINHNLTEFLISHNQIDFNGTSPNILKNFRKIQILDFSFNSIRQFPYNMLDMPSTTHSKPKTMKYNRNPFFSKNYGVRINLAHNKISQVKFLSLKNIKMRNSNVSTRIEVDISNNPIYCDCQAQDLISYIKDSKNKGEIPITLKYNHNLYCSGPSNLFQMPISSVDEKGLSCSLNNCTRRKECDCSYISGSETIVFNCSNRNISDIPELLIPELIDYYDFVRLNKVEVVLENNFLNKSPSDLEGYSNVTSLYLQNNSIKSITWIPQTIEVLNLENNKLESLDNNFLSLLDKSNIIELNLESNPWRCDCDIKNFIDFLLEHITQVHNASNIRCNGTGDVLVNLDGRDLCPKKTGFVLIISSVSLFCLIAIITIILLYCIYQKEILIFLYAHGACLWLVKEERIDKNKKYDAFITFAHQDEDFVTRELVPVLEEPPHPYKLCIHIRDWIPGEFITTQIANSVRDSRRTMVILSSDFLRSVWGKMEFKTAHTAAMKEGIVRVIIVIYGNIDMNSLDDELKAYMRTNTYIKWGDPWFWEKLRYALPRTHLRTKKRNVRTQTNIGYNDLELQ